MRVAGVSAKTHRMTSTVAAVSIGAMAALSGQAHRGGMVRQLTYPTVA